MILLGNSGVGKSNLIARFHNNEFSEDFESTVGVEFVTKRMDVDGVPIKLQVSSCTATRQAVRVSELLARASQSVGFAYWYNETCALCSRIVLKSAVRRIRYRVHGNKRITCLRTGKDWGTILVFSLAKSPLPNCATRRLCLPACIRSVPSSEISMHEAPRRRYVAWTCDYLRVSKAANFYRNHTSSTYFG